MQQYRQFMERYEWFQVPASVGVGTAVWPGGLSGFGFFTTSMATGLTQAGRKVLLHCIINLAGGTPGSSLLTILHGDGVTAYFPVGYLMASNPNGFGAGLNLYLGNGLAVAPGVAVANWIVAYSLL